MNMPPGRYVESLTGRGNGADDDEVKSSGITRHLSRHCEEREACVVLV